MLIIALIAGRGAEDPTISVVMMLTDCPSGLNSQKRLSLWVEAARLLCALQLQDKTGSGGGGGGGEGQNGSKKVGGSSRAQTRGQGKLRATKVTCNPAKSPLAMVSSHTHLARAELIK